MIRLTDVHNNILPRIDFNRSGFVVFTTEAEFSATAKGLALIPPKWIGDVNQLTAVVIHTASFEFIEGIIGETEMKMKQKDCEEKEDRAGNFHFRTGL